MRLVVVGADGAVGRLLVEQALGHGHEVTRVVAAGTVSSHAEAVTRGIDITSLDAMGEAIAGHTGVAVALEHARVSRASTRDKVLAAVVYGMAMHGATRLAVLSAAGTFARTDRGLPLAARAQIATILRADYDDLEAMERRITATDFSWTIVRPTTLMDAPATGHYRISRDGSVPSKARPVSRADVAAVLLKALETETFHRRALVVAQ